MELGVWSMKPGFEVSAPGVLGIHAGAVGVRGGCPGRLRGQATLRSAAPGGEERAETPIFSLFWHFLHCCCVPSLRAGAQRRRKRTPMLACTNASTCQSVSHKFRARNGRSGHCAGIIAVCSELLRSPSPDRVLHLCSLDDPPGTAPAPPPTAHKSGAVLLLTCELQHSLWCSVHTGALDALLKPRSGAQTPREATPGTASPSAAGGSTVLPRDDQQRVTTGAAAALCSAEHWFQKLRAVSQNRASSARVDQERNPATKQHPHCTPSILAHGTRWAGGLGRCPGGHAAHPKHGLAKHGHQDLQRLREHCSAGSSPPALPRRVQPLMVLPYASRTRAWR